MGNRLGPLFGSILGSGPPPQPLPEQIAQAAHDRYMDDPSFCRRANLARDVAVRELEAEGFKVSSLGARLVLRSVVIALLVAEMEVSHG